MWGNAKLSPNWVSLAFEGSSLEDFGVYGLKSLSLSLSACRGLAEQRQHAVRERGLRRYTVHNCIGSNKVKGLMIVKMVRYCK